MYRVRLFPFETSFGHVHTEKHAMIEGRNQIGQMWENCNLEFEVTELPLDGGPELEELHKDQWSDDEMEWDFIEYSPES